MSGRVYCPECGASYFDPFEVLDGAPCGALISGDAWCKGRLTAAGVAIRSLARARDTAHAEGYAAGYAEAVADVREMLAELEAVADPIDAGSGVFEFIQDKLVYGAHVGAAKKGGG